MSAAALPSTTPASRAPRVLVRQIGPGRGVPGGIASVLATYAVLPWDDVRLEFFDSYHPDDALWSLRRFLKVAFAIVSRPRDRHAPVHVHLSEGGSFVREGGLLLLARALGAPVVVSLHGAEFEPFAARHPRLARAVLGRADVVVALGQWGANSAQPLVGTRTRIVVIPNPIAVPAEVTDASSADAVVFFGGEVGLRKGVDVLIEAWAQVRERHPGARLVVAGPPKDVEVTPAPDVDVLGNVARESIGAHLAACRVAVLPSRFEVMPMFVLEAMANARPVVTTAVGDTAAALGDGGILVPPGDAGALADALTALLDDPAEATRLGAAGRARVEQVYAGDVIARELEALYVSLVR